jgi:hypothetical protein
MRQTFIDIIKLIVSIIAAIFGYIFVDVGIHAYDQSQLFWVISIGAGLMLFSLAHWQGGPLLYRGWRQLRQMDKIEEMDQRYAQLCEDAAGFYADAANLYAELENEIRNNEYNTKRMENELSILKDKYEILYRTLIYNVTNPENAGFDIMVKEAGRQSNLAKLVVDEHIRLNMSPENLSQIKAQDFATFLAKINIKK